MRPGLYNPFFAYWVHDLSPFLIRFTENVGIRYYGLAYVLGFLIAAYLLRLYFKYRRSPFDPEQQQQIMMWGIIGVLVGGRIGYMLLYDIHGLLSDPLSLFAVWRGGMSSHGGFIGVILVLWIFARRTGQSFLLTGDIAVTLMPAGLFLGRIANFINGELWGKVTTVPWAVIFPKSAFTAATPLEEIPPRHPSQLYEAVFEGLFLAVWVQLRFWRKTLLPKGQLSGEFLLLYAVLRIFAEIFREPDRSISLILGLSRGQFYSLFLALGGIILIVFSRYAAKKDTLLFRKNVKIG